MTDDPALALLAEALMEAEDEGITWEEKADSIFATGPGTRLLAALRDGLAVAALPDYWEVEKLEGSGWIIRDQHGYARNPDEVGIEQPATLHAAVAAALAPETSE